MKLVTRRVEKPWGRDSLPAIFGPSDGRRIGEIWFEDPSGLELPLLPKFLFTSERLSVQVHPSGEQAGDSHRHEGRAECWYIVDAQEDARVGFGLRQPMTVDAAREAALDGSLPDMLDWHPVKSGDFIFVPSGVVHAIGAGLTIIEFQQSADVTYRLFDYGRGRPVQLDEALAVAELGPADPANFIRNGTGAERILVSVPQFTVARISSRGGAEWMADRLRWAVPISGSVATATVTAQEGECLLAAPGEPLTIEGETLALVAAEGAYDEAGISRT